MSQLISSIAQLLWPLITLTAIFVFRRAIGRVLKTAEKRELEFEVGGQKLTMHELNDQQNDMIQDLQRQLSMLSKQLDTKEQRVGAGPLELEEVLAPPPPLGSELEESDLPDVHAPVGPEPFAVLWVAERPESHALLVEQLRDNGVRVSMVASTGEALSELSERPYRLIISDMSRTEDGRYRSDAGLVLLRELRDLGVDTPVIIYCGQRGELQYGTQAKQAGAVAVTSSAYEMFKHFQSFGLL
ncbi:response regulator receiver domain-containing protein [Saccharopolyspora erythraea NRRL 2338]|uniref:Two-component response regulator n=2 Tax=Saccharopolyspora erythraea TaxID=1836 RepID=A4F9D6_SACEN|nr:response regulator [Saccharopolyspora erythraea]EQD82185.1 chemotaxis protein CheY [Saccharopolyspora erythraea D]PFG94449.1 response regulator receiver domain-containing protein [Saccharopolyspora erythraea NRRL 2338]QRK91207.1 response regulator [Saccharopolyspora erythraea]CAM00661.1 two-component response regulator [Saccharopolyspora erythraea NRRL 2338]